MPRITHLLLLAALPILCRAASAADQTVAYGVGSRGYTSTVTGMPGPSAESGLAHPGLALQSAGAVGVSPAGCAGSTNIGGSDGFHAAGMGKITTAGVGQGTYETVPGKSVDYVPIVAGTRMAPLVGGRGR